MQRTSVKRASAITFLAACLLGTSYHSGVAAAYPAVVDQISKRLVFAEVHPWNATPAVDGFWARWNDLGRNPGRNDLASSFWPKGGPYSMGDCAHVRTVGTNLKTAGVDVAVIDWVNFYRDEESRLATILECINLPTVIMVEPTWGRESFSDVQARLNTLIGWYARKTSTYPNYYRDPISRYPVVFVWDPGKVASVAQWNSYLNHLKTQAPEHGIFIAGLGSQTPVDFVRNSMFDGALAENGAEPPAQDRADVEWVLSALNQSRWQFLVANSVPGFNRSTDGSDPDPRIIDRIMSNFDSRWGVLVNARWNTKKVHSAFVMYNNDGEDAGIEPAAPSPPQRQPGFQTCGGRVTAKYLTYPNSPDGQSYLYRNKYWADRFRASR